MKDDELTVFQDKGFPSVSVVIPARNAGSTIIHALDALQAQDYPAPMEVIVADGSETQTMADLIRKHHPSVKIIPNPDRVLVTGANKAFRVAAGDIVVRCDAHTIFPSDYVRRAVETMERTGAANVGGRQMAVGKSFFQRTVAIAFTTVLGAGDARHRIGGEAGAVDTTFLGVLTRETLLNELNGGYSYLARNEDYELNYRLRKLGKTVWFDPDLVVEYWPRDSLSGLAKQYFNYGRGKSIIMMRHPASVRMRHLAPPALVLGLAVGAALTLFGFPWLLGALLLAYAAVILGGTAVVGFQRRDAAVLLLPIALLTMHLCWGAGIFFPERLPPPPPPPPQNLGEQ